ncbi:MAG: histone deacetylase [Pseudomonadota bacterium]
MPDPVSMLPILHHPEYDADTVGTDHRFPMRKYTLVAQQLRAAGYRFQMPDHAPQSWLELAHDPDYVQAVLTSSLHRQAARRIGFEMTPAIAARSCASVGGTVLAARIALETGAAVNLAGGSHHADYAGGAGFCVFNDVAVAARVLLQEGQVKRPAVLDLDVHHGDGTALIFAADEAVFTASLHCSENWPRIKPPSDFDLGLARGTGDDDYLSGVDQTIDAVLSHSPDLVFYNAGVDPHLEDRLGLLEVSDAGLSARDDRVAAALQRAGVPMVGVLGGGYAKDASAVAQRHLFLVQAFEKALELTI